MLGHFDEITPNQYLLWHAETGHNPGGLHAAFRVLRTFLLWYECEAEPDAWTNPIHKVKAPKLTIQPLLPVEVEDVSLLVKACNSGSFLEYRDKALVFVN